MKHLVIFIILFGFMWSSCNKDKTIETILGQWEIKSYTVKEVELLDSVKTRIGDCYGNLSFTINYGYHNVFMQGECTFGGTFDYWEDHLRFSLFEPGAPTLLVDSGIQFAIFDDITWEIQELENQDLRLKCRYLLEEQVLILSPVN